MPKLIIIVEDDELNARFFRDLLAANGYRTEHHALGREVLPAARASRPDLVLIDLQLPDISGLDVVAELKADPELAQVPVVAVTAYSVRLDAVGRDTSGCDAFLLKPVGIRTLLDTVERLTDGHAGPAEAPPAT